MSTAYLWAMLVLWIVIGLASLTSKAGEPVKRTQRGMRIERGIVVVMAVWTVACLAGCGGSTDPIDDDPKQTISPPDCKAHPEQCT